MTTHTFLLTCPHAGRPKIQISALSAREHGIACMAQRFVNRDGDGLWAATGRTCQLGLTRSALIEIVHHLAYYTDRGEQTTADKALSPCITMAVEPDAAEDLGDPWQRPGLSLRERSLITLIARAAEAREKPEHLDFEIARAHRNGLHVLSQVFAKAEQARSKRRATDDLFATAG